MGYILALVLALLVPLQTLAASGGKLPGEEIVGRADDEDPKAFLKRVKGDLQKVDASIEATKELLSKSKDSPLLPDVMLRLAELYVEKSRLLYYKAVEERGNKSGGEAITAPDSKHFKELAIEQYKKILKEFPGYAQNDKIRFFLGHEYQELAMPAEMLREYTRLTQDYPHSPLVPEAFLILGNFYFEKRDFETSEKNYEEVVKRNDAGLAALARYKLGWIEMNKSEHKKALAHFEAAARSANAFAMRETNASLAQRQKLKSVRREALTDSVQPFTEVRKPEEAVGFYGELADTRNLYSAILEKLGNRYYVQQNWAPSAKIYRTLVTLTHDVDRSYEFGQRFFECSAKAVQEAAKKPNAPSTEKIYAQLFDSDDARSLTETMVRFSSSWRIPKKDRDAGVKEYELYVRDISTKLQLASEKEPDPERKKAAAWEAAKAYQAYLSFFKDPQQRPAMEENYAEALAAAGKHWEAARQYEKIARSDKKNEKDLVHSALAEFHIANTKDRDRLTRFRRVQAREGEKQLGEYYAQVFPDGKDVASVEFNVARAYYEEGNYKVAIDLFKQYITEHPGAKESYASANLVLDSYAQLEDFTALSETAKKFASDSKLPDPKFRSQFAEIAKQADFRRVGNLLAEGDSDEDPAEKLARLAESSAGSELGEKALYTLFVTNRDRGEADKIFDAGERFLARYPSSEFAGEILGSIAKLAIESADFSRAAAYYERFAKARPSDKGAAELLERAATIREKMGDANRAAAAYQVLPKMGRLPAKDAALKTVVAYKAVGDWPKAANAAKALIAAGHDGPFAHWVIGWAALKAGRRDEAKLSFVAAVGRARAGQIQTSEDKEAAAHAAFLLADESKKDFESVQHGGDLVTTLGRKVEMAQQLEASMAEVVTMGSGEWAIAATFRVGQAYRAAAEFFRKSPVPPEVVAEDRVAFAKLLDERAQPLDQKAKESFAACLSKANELKIYSPWVAACASGREPGADIAPPPPRGGRGNPPAELVNALAKDPLNATLLTRMASGYLNNGDPYTAELVARRAIEVDDTSANAHTVLALALLRRGEIADAADSFEAAAERAPGRPKEWLNWAAHQYAYGDPRKAVQSLKRATNPRSVDPSGNDVHPQARRLLTDAPRLMSMK